MTSPMLIESWKSSNNLAGFMHQLRIQLMSCRSDLSFRRCFKNRATRFMQMPAVIEAALTEERPEVRERTLQLSLRQMMQPELLEPRRIDQRSSPGERL